MASEYPDRAPKARARWAEAITRSIEESGALASAGRKIARAYSRIVRPGPLKDVLSGTWLGHPLHPLLTDVAIGAWTSAAILDVAGGDTTARASDRLVGAGLLAAVPTAITGWSDFADVTSDDERATGITHALSNATAVALYVAGYAMRKRGRRGPGVALTMAGAAAATAGGFLGGHLAYRLGIGVDQTTFDGRIRDWTAVLPAAELPEGEPRRVSVARTNMMLYRRGDRVHAIANRCSHRGGPLHKGRVGDGVVRCPWHYSRFRLEDGCVVGGPATARQPVYEARVRDGTIEVRGPA